MSVAKFEVKADGRRVGVTGNRQQAKLAVAKYRNYGYKASIRRIAR